MDDLDRQRFSSVVKYLLIPGYYIWRIGTSFN